MHPGRYYALVDARCEPAPFQSALPMLVGGGGERRTLPIAARYADARYTSASSREFASSSISSASLTMVGLRGHPRGTGNLRAVEAMQRAEDRASSEIPARLGRQDVVEVEIVDGRIADVFTQVIGAGVFRR